MNQPPVVEIEQDAAHAREEMVTALLSDRHITDPEVERAFRTVPRHRFVAEGTSLVEAYNTADSVAVKYDEDGVIISSTSAPFIQARMIEQAGLRPGMRVLEVGSGGYNAALLAEVVGENGRVVSIDIDPEVTERAKRLLAANGYEGRVSVVLADAEQPPAADTEEFDAVVITAGAWDLAPAWRDRLAEAGTLVVPLRMNGVTRSIAFRRAGNCWVSASAEVCGFVPMQGAGAGAHDERVFLLPSPTVAGASVKLRFEDGPPQEMNLLDEVLAGSPSEVFSGVTIPRFTSFAGLHLWLACFAPGFCKLAVDDGIDMLGENTQWFPFGLVAGAGFAHLVLRRTADGETSEFGARGYGRDGAAAARALAEHIRAWQHGAGPEVEPSFAYWPTGTTPPAPEAARVAVMAKTHGALTISWPG